MFQALRIHWREYLIEAAGLGVFMVAAGGVVTLLESPILAIPEIIPNSLERRVLIGIAMGLTAIAIIYSRWGKRSGAHINPAVTLTFFRLGKLASWDALFYVLAQFIGGTMGIILVKALLGKVFTEPPINYVVTVPGMWGWFPALIAEFMLSFGLMLIVLLTSNTQHLANFTGWFAGCLVAIYIIVEAPISGMSINPARTFASAFPSQIWTGFWIYYFAPPLGMLFAAEIYLRYFKRPKILCGKLYPNDDTPCPCLQCCCRIMEEIVR
ncbi:MIP/aquaporin family protein [Chroococcus sp. FPU101]|uniref:MIP/aquaporin family protein n=1 Tax=Chroococcus sp. FPU101 TaxID=1974212 RepID=UPI001A9047DF|nr:aquaporin [Chroococcus sp. FPU101]GFE69957.1 major intrinsic protein [Chroococcus sp. FPU101]